MEYKIKNINVNAENPSDIVFPDIKDRVIEKYGQVLEFTMNDIELNLKNLNNVKRELEAKKEYENARVENIEHFHPFVLGLSEEELVTAWLYKEATGLRKMASDKLKLIEEQLTKDLAEIEEIKKQIPELSNSPIIQETVKILNDK